MIRGQSLRTALCLPYPAVYIQCVCVCVCVRERERERERAGPDLVDGKEGGS